MYNFDHSFRIEELAEIADAADVAFRVGYESPSQFSREYYRMFGLPPKEDIKRLRSPYDQIMNVSYVGRLL